MEKLDVLVIGAGPGGYVAAIRAAQLGMRVGCVEKWRNPAGEAALGGTCLNIGCIPSKALLDSSEQFARAREQFAAHGIRTEKLEMDVAVMMQRKAGIVHQLTKGIAALFAKHGIEWLQGNAKLLGDGQVEVSGPAGPQVISAEHIILATGSAPVALDLAPVDGEFIIDSSGALELPAVPERLGIIGAGVIGLELGSVWRRLGSKVTLLEALPEFLPAADRDIAREAARQFAAQGLEVQLNARVTGTTREKNRVEVTYESPAGAKTAVFDRLVVAVGRRPCTDGLNAEAAGLELDERGYIVTDRQFRTSVPGIYAIGDVVRGPMLAHRASEDGIAVAECLAGQAGASPHDKIPWVIYTWPEIAWVGKTEAELKQAGRACKTGRFPFAASGRARAMGETGGLVKIIADAVTDRILGVHVIGPFASELIAEAVLALEFGASAEDLARTVHAHPTLAEALHEAALAVDKRAIHI